MTRSVHQPIAEQTILKSLLGTLVLAAWFVAGGCGGHPAPASRGTLFPATSTPAAIATQGQASAATQTLEPTAVAVSPAGDVYVADGTLPSSCRVWRLRRDGALDLVAGTGTCGYSGDGGPATRAAVYAVSSIAFDGAGDIYLADHAECRVREIADAVITTVAGNGTCGFAGDGGPANAAELNQPVSVAVDAQDDLFISDDWNCRVRMVRAATISTVAGDGSCSYSGDGAAASHAGIEPSAIALAPDGTLYIADVPNIIEQHAAGGACRVRAVRHGVITTVAGNGCFTDPKDDSRLATGTSLSLLSSISVGSAGSLYIVDGYCALRIVRGAAIETILRHGSDPAGICRGGGTQGPLNTDLVPGSVAIGPDGTIYLTDGRRCTVYQLQGAVARAIAGSGKCPQ